MPLAAAIVVCLLEAMPAHADTLTVSLSPLSDVAAGSTGNSFDVLLTNTSGSAVSIEAFFFEVQSSSSDITFTDATTATGTPYIFGSDSLFGPDIIGLGSTATDLNASDLDASRQHFIGSGGHRWHSATSFSTFPRRRLRKMSLSPWRDFQVRVWRMILATTSRFKRSSAANWELKALLPRSPNPRPWRFSS